MYRELVEWAILFSLVRTHTFGSDTLIVCDGLLRSKVFAGEHFRTLLAGFDAAIKDQYAKRRRRIYLVGVAKHNSALARYRLAMALEHILTTPYAAYVEIPRDIENKAYVWGEYARDEAGWARDDELFSSLLAGQASVDDPLMLVTSTVGRRQAGPLWTIKALAEGGDPHVSWHWHGQNLSPRVTKQFLDRQRRILMPAQFAREHQNQWVDAADSFTSAAEVEAAMAHGWVQQHVGRPDQTYEGFVDIGLVSDPTVLALGHAKGSLTFIDVLLTLEGSRVRPVQLTEVEAAVQDLSRRFRVRRWRIESWQGVAAVQSLQRVGLPVELFAPTAKAHAEEWPMLAQRLSSRTIVLPKHEPLREELLNLTVELGPQGVRVIDKGKVHQDHAVCVRGVVASLAATRPDTPEFIRACLEAGSEPGLMPTVPIF